MSDSRTARAHAKPGAISVLYCALTLIVLGATLFVSTRYEPLLVRSAIDRNFALRVGLGLGIAVLLELVLGVWLVLRHAATAPAQRRTRALLMVGYRRARARDRLA